MGTKLLKLICTMLILLSTCPFDSMQMFQQAESDIYNLKWSTIQSWLNITSNADISPKVKFLCTNRFIDLIATMCRQYLAAEYYNESSLENKSESDFTLAQNQLPRFRHSQKWNFSVISATNKRLKNLLKVSLPANAIIHECCLQACNVTSFIRYCPSPNWFHQKEQHSSLGTLTIFQRQNGMRQSVHANEDNDQSEPSNNNMRNYESRRINNNRSSRRRNFQNRTRTPLLPSTPSQEQSEASNELRSNARVVDSRSTVHKSLFRSSRANRNLSTPEPYTFPQQSSDIFYRP